MRALPIVIFVVGCGGQQAAAPPSAPPTPPPVASAEAPTPPTPIVAKKEPEGPPFVIEKLAVAPKMKGEAVQLLDLSWDVTRKGEVEKGTILFVHTTCKVGYSTKYEDETLSGVDVLPTGAPRRFTVPAFASVGLPFEPSWCTIAIASGTKGTSSETKLSSFCWKKGTVSDGPCG